jgi:hypothetical protein
MPYLDEQTGQNIPIMIHWTFTSATLRAVSTDPITGVAYTAADINKVAWQSDTNRYYTLASTTPTWTPFVMGADAATPQVFIPGTLTASTTAMVAMIVLKHDLNISKAAIDIDSGHPPTGSGSAVTVDIKYGTSQASAASIFSGGSPSIASGTSTFRSEVTPVTTSFAENGYLLYYITAVGSTSTGSNLNINMEPAATS